MKLWFSYLAIAALVLLTAFDILNFGFSITTLSTFVIAILFIASLRNKIIANKKK